MLKDNVLIRKIKTQIISILVVFLFVCCEKEATVKNYLSEPPVIKGLILRDHIGNFIRKLGTPNVKYIYGKNSSSSQRIMVYPTFFNTGLPVNSTTIMFNDNVKQNVTVTIVEGTLNMDLSTELNISNKIVKNKNFIVYQTQITVDQINNGDVGVLLSSIKKPGVYRIYIDFGDNVLYDNLLIQ